MMNKWAVSSLASIWLSDDCKPTGGCSEAKPWTITVWKYTWNYQTISDWQLLGSDSGVWGRDKLCGSSWNLGAAWVQLQIKFSGPFLCRFWKTGCCWCTVGPKQIGWGLFVLSRRPKLTNLWNRSFDGDQWWCTYRSLSCSEDYGYFISSHLPVFLLFSQIKVHSSRLCQNQKTLINVAIPVRCL